MIYPGPPLLHAVTPSHTQIQLLPSGIQDLQAMLDRDCAAQKGPEPQPQQLGLGRQKRRKHQPPEDECIVLDSDSNPEDDCEFEEEQEESEPDAAHDECLEDDSDDDNDGDHVDSCDPKPKHDSSSNLSVGQLGQHDKPADAHCDDRDQDQDSDRLADLTLATGQHEDVVVGHDSDQHATTESAAKPDKTPDGEPGSGGESQAHDGNDDANEGGGGGGSSSGSSSSSSSSSKSKKSGSGTGSSSSSSSDSDSDEQPQPAELPDNNRFLNMVVAEPPQAAGDDQPQAHRRPRAQAIRINTSPVAILVQISPVPHCTISLNMCDHRFVSKWKRGMQCDAWDGELQNQHFTKIFDATSADSWQSALRAVHARVWRKYHLAARPLNLHIGIRPQQPGEVPDAIYRQLAPVISGMPAARNYYNPAAAE